MSRMELHDRLDGSEPSAPEVLSIGPSGPPRRRSGSLVAAAVVAVVVVGALFGWQQLRPSRNLTLAQVQDAYGRMVRPDGTDAVTTIDPSKFSPRPMWTSPEECAPLFASTVASRFPAPALDGVSAHRLDRRGSISLLTVRYADAAGASAAYGTVVDAVRVCDGRTVRFSSRRGPGTIRSLPVSPVRGAPEQIAYVLERERRGGRYGLQLLRLGNTVTWQYRYHYGAGSYDADASQQLMNGLARELISVREADGGS